LTGALAIPESLRRDLPRIFGQRGRDWLDALPAATYGLAERWRLGLGPAYGGGTHALVLAVTRADGSPAALKVPVVDDENYAEADALLAYDGDGAVRLLDYDRGSGALLLERAEPGTALLEHPDRDAAVEIACRLLRRLRRPAPPGARFPLARHVAAGWVDGLPDRQRGHRLAELDRLLPDAVATAERYADAPAGPELLINRDLHLGNILRARREPWLLIDPKPLVGEAAFEGGFPVLKRLEDAGPDPGPLVADRAADQVAAGLAVDVDRVRGWALLRAMESALWTADQGRDPGTELGWVRALAPA
jgi:streptomycin 6-kinase